MEMKFGKYLAVEEVGNVVGIYDLTFYPKKLLTYKDSWEKATNTATLLMESHYQSYAVAR